MLAVGSCSVALFCSLHEEVEWITALERLKGQHSLEIIDFFRAAVGRRCASLVRLWGLKRGLPVSNGMRSSSLLAL